VSSTPFSHALCVFGFVKGSSSVRVVALNIQHGGGRRTQAISDALLAATPDVVVLSEFHVGPGGSRLLEQLFEAGLTEHAQAKPSSIEYPNTVAIASRLPLGNVQSPLGNSANRHRVLEVDVAGFTLGAVYFPLGKPKLAFWRDEFLPYAASRIGRPSLLIGDWNSGRHYLDESGATLHAAREFEAMTEAGWVDAWRSLRPDGREYTWYSTHGNGFRLDHAFLSPPLAPRLESAAYRHETRRSGITDHSAMDIELESWRPQGSQPA
jgi:exodeoxyribonuclease III